MQALLTIAPILLVGALGAALRAGGMLTPGLVSGLNRLVFYVGLPPLLFAKIAATPLDLAPVLWVLAVSIGVMVVAILGVALGCRLRGCPQPVAAALVQAGFRSNTVFVGLPIVIYAVEAQGGSEGLLQTATLAIAALVPFLNIAAVLVLGVGGGEGGGGWRGQLRKLGSNPLLLGSVAGLAVAVLGWEVPDVIDRTARSLGQVALRLALLGIGASLSWEPVRRHAVGAVVATAVKVVLCPLAGYLVAQWCGLGPEETFLTLVFLACPTAVNAFIMAEQMRADADLTAAAIVLSTVCAVVPLTAIVALGW